MMTNTQSGCLGSRIPKVWKPSHPPRSCWVGVEGCSILPASTLGWEGNKRRMGPLQYLLICSENFHQGMVAVSVERISHLPRPRGGVVFYDPKRSTLLPISRALRTTPPSLGTLSEIHSPLPPSSCRNDMGAKRGVLLGYMGTW